MVNTENFNFKKYKNIIRVDMFKILKIYLPSPLAVSRLTN